MGTIFTVGRARKPLSVAAGAAVNVVLAAPDLLLETSRIPARGRAFADDGQPRYRPGTERRQK
jgi:hypothetical protein